ncbi:MAG TPA: MarR family transcriptional regulator [Parvularcula sp.]|nr:MarR family transcriptional regulator [Parvularcula sp.]HBS34173.1 MarR family transcriptional regulator [Parvularcula sp.]
MSAPRLKLDAFTPYRIVALGRRMSEALGAAYRNEGISIPEWRVMAAVAQAPSVAARDVVAVTPMDKMAVSRAVAALERKGLIEREQRRDRRVSTLKLTAKGETLFERIAAIALRYEDSLLQRLPPSTRKAFLDGLAALETVERAAE